MPKLRTRLKWLLPRNLSQQSFLFRCCFDSVLFCWHRKSCRIASCKWNDIVHSYSSLEKSRPTLYLKFMIHSLPKKVSTFIKSIDGAQMFQISSKDKMKWMTYHSQMLFRTFWMKIWMNNFWNSHASKTSRYLDLIKGNDDMNDKSSNNALMNSLD